MLIIQSAREARADMFRLASLQSEPLPAAMMCIPAGSAVIDVTAVSEAAAVPEAVAGDNGVSVVHKGGGFAPAALVEIASRARVVPRVGHVAAAREAADVPWPVAMRDEI